MEMAAILAAGLRDWIDFGVIIGILMLNATVGWYQEKQAADVVASLKGDIAMKALVVRDRQEQEIKARDIVPGDIVCIIEYRQYCDFWPAHRPQIILEEGCTVPGEARLICAYDDPEGFEKYRQQQNTVDDDVSTEKSDEDSTHRKEEAWGSSIVAIDQSAMTGESLAVRSCSEC